MHRKLVTEKVDCMAGIEFLSGLNKTANLNTSNVTKEANCCSNSNSNNSKNNNVTSCLCNKHLNACKANNYKTKQHQQQRPLTLCLVVMMALTLTLMPQYANAAALRKELPADGASSSQTAIERELLLLSSAEELIEEAMKDVISAKLASSASASSSASLTSESSESVDSLDVLKHMKLKEEHQKERRTKLRKRHINHLDNLKYFDGSSHQVEWHNPCNVARENHNFIETSIPRKAYYYLRKFKEDIRKEYITRNLGLKHIKIDDMESWRLHRDYYTFLPKLKQNSKISLSRWYRNMQMYVASFAYLGRTQYNWDMKKQRYVGETTKELDQLLSSARLILCELETAINGSHPSKNVNMLKSLSREEMADRLDFQTKEQERNGLALIEPSILDLKFTKDSYLKYLATMRKILKRKLNTKNRDVKVDSSENTSAESSNNAIDDNESSINVSSVMRSDSNLSLGESFEMIMKSSNQQTSQQRRNNRTARRHNASRKSAELPEM